MLKNFRIGLFGLFFSYLSIFIVISVLGKIFLWILLHATAFASFRQMTTIILWGLKFDASIATLFSFFCCVAHDTLSRRKTFYVVLGFIITHVLITTSDFMYFDHVGRHIIYEYSTFIRNFGNIVLAAKSEHTTAFVFTLLIIPILFFSVQAVTQKIHSMFAQPSNIAGHLTSYFILLALAVLIFRGGPTGIALKPQHFYKAKDSRYAVLGWNPTYYFFHSLFFKGQFQYPQISTDEESIALWKKYYEARPRLETPPQKKYNVVFILLESWTGEYSIESSISEKVTPFLSQLYKKSLSTLATVAGGARTTEGIFALFCSFQNPLGRAVPDSNLGFLEYSCLPEYLKKHGWSSTFVQGTTNETSNVGPFAQKVGFETSYGKQAFKNGRLPLNNWGYYDQDVYDFAIGKMDELQEPFVIGINTNTTHSNELPDGVKFAFDKNTAEENYKSVIHFADQALQEFFQKIENKKYFSNTIFVIASDHTGFSKRNQIVHRFLIPGLIYAPHIVKPQKLPIISTQRDFAPTVIDLLGGYLPTLAGDSLLKLNRNVPPAECYNNSTLVTVSGKTVVNSDLAANSETCYDFAYPEFPERACKDEDLKAAAEAKAFTRMSQSLLLKGQTRDLLEFGKQFNNN